MGQLIIPGSGDFPPIPFVTVTALSELSTYVPTILQGTWTSETQATEVWGGAGGYLKTRKQVGVNNHYVEVKRLNGSENPYPQSEYGYPILSNYNYLVVFAFRVEPVSGTAYNKVVWLFTETENYTSALNNLINNDYVSECVLFRSEGEIPSFVEEARDWDETPSEDPEDPDGMLPQGGEHADLMAFDNTHIMTIEDMPNPEVTMNMDYGGFLRTYVLDQSMLTAVGSALFSPNFWTGLKQKFEGLSDPLQMIVNCIQIPIWNIGGSSGTMRIGGVEVEDEQGETISVMYTSSRYIKYNMGSVTLKEVWGSEKDYNDSSISIFLPYVGIKELDPDIVIGNTLTLMCYVDIWTGDVTYLMHVSNATASKKYFTAASVPYRWTGNCSKTVPIGRVDNTNKIITMAGTIAGLGAGAMLAGIGGAAVAGGVLSGAAGAVGASNAALGAGLGTMKAGGAIAAVTAAKALHSGFNPTVHSSSGVQGASGQMDYQYAYVMVKRGVPKYPANWREQIGAPNYQTFQGLSMSGYTLFSEIHLTGMADASEAERAELERQLTEEGVIL